MPRYAVALTRKFFLCSANYLQIIRLMCTERETTMRPPTKEAFASRRLHHNSPKRQPTADSWKWQQRSQREVRDIGNRMTKDDSSTTSLCLFLSPSLFHFFFANLSSHSTSKTTMTQQLRPPLIPSPFITTLYRRVLFWFVHFIVSFLLPFSFYSKDYDYVATATYHPHSLPPRLSSI